MPTVPKEAEGLSFSLLLTLFSFLKHSLSFCSYEAKAILACKKERLFQFQQQQLFSVTGNAAQLGALEFNTHSPGRVRASVFCHMVAQEKPYFCS